ncbi:MAG: hypothetical protein Q4F30_02025 [Akkermansia sp.]|nr:hypothetical protein [Akkermansia sp.]
MKICIMTVGAAHCINKPVRQMISAITIKNVKGYNLDGKRLDVNLNPKKINICMAPNGFGKTSLATAFLALKNGKLEVSEENKNRHFTNESSHLGIVLNGKEIWADSDKNDISKHISVDVINCRASAGYTKRIYGRISNVNAFIKIDGIDVCKAESKVSVPYSIQDLRKEFGRNGKILKSIQPMLDNPNFMSCLKDNLSVFAKFLQVRRSALLDAIRDAINSMTGTEVDIRNQLEDETFESFREDDNSKKIAHLLRCFGCEYGDLECFSFIYQMSLLYKKEYQKIRKLCSYSEYKVFKDRLNSNLEFVNSSSNTIEAKEHKGKLRIVFPIANQLSNGQRDILTFVAQLILFKSSVADDKKYLLVVDEVFDYLDDANMLAAQYYLSEILKISKGNIYIVVLTHLNECNFRNYIFNKNKINSVHLDSSAPRGHRPLMEFISFRQKLEVGAENDKELYIKICNNLFHYHPSPMDLSEQLKEIGNSKIRASWGNPDTFKKYLIEQTNNYIHGETEYDPYAVALALRIRVEKNMYDMIDDDEDKKQYISTHMTKNKYDFCIARNIDVPDAYNLVGAIYNDACHLQKKKDCEDFDEHSAVYKLQNAVIKSIIEKLFDCNGNSDLALDALK